MKMEVNNLKDKYTVSVCSLLEHGYNIFGFEYPLKKQLKPEFEKAFTEWYLFSEIFCYMPTMFFQRLNSVLLLKSEYYNKLFEIENTKYNPLINKQLKVHGISENVRLNDRSYDYIKEQLQNLWEKSQKDNDEKYKQNIEETGETTGLKDTTTDDHLTHNIDTVGTLDKDVDTVGSLDKTVDTVTDKDSQENIVKDAESDKVNHLEESGTSHSTHRYCDTPQNDLSSLSPPTQLNPFGQYLTYIEDTNGTTTHEADSTENIVNHEETETIYHEDTTELETTHQDTTENEVTKQETTEVQDKDQQQDIIYHEETEGTHHFINDEKHRKSSFERLHGEQEQKDNSHSFGNEQYKLNDKNHSDELISGFENTSLSRLLEEWRLSTHNIIEQFVKEQDFENLFMGVL